MPQAKRGSKLKRREAALVLGAAGVCLALAGGASATAKTTNVPSQDDACRIILDEEEISDVSLATFHLFDKENKQRPRARFAMGACAGCGCGCGGCGCGCGSSFYYNPPPYGDPPLLPSARPTNKYRHSAKRP
jgi:hypothetical protein